MYNVTILVLYEGTRDRGILMEYTSIALALQQYYFVWGDPAVLSCWWHLTEQRTEDDAGV